ncbi:HAMP domain-containing protein [Bradyrhizobium japonicum]|uniref:HAMP domain-containing protein n=1 Tax=Bradyrhizobium japonicum TaxID=375 RepID=A0ABV2S143_BRAJP
MLSLIQNLRIGTKLAVASALGILLVAAMIAGQIVGNGNVRHSNESALAQQVLARDAVEATLALRSMQLSARDIRLASNPADLQKANDSLLERSRSFSDAVEAMLKLSRSLENRARMEELKRLLMVYLEGVHQLASIRSEAIAVTGGDAAARLAKFAEENARVTREITLPNAAKMDTLTNQIADFAKHRSEEEIAGAAQEMAASERLGIIIGACAMLVLIASWFMSFVTIARPISALTVAMNELAGGNFAVVLPGLGRKDEVGGVAGAVERFKVVSEQKARDEAEAKIRQDKVATEQRKAEMRKLADSFESARGRDRRYRLLGIDRAGGLRLGAHLDRGARPGAHHHGRCGVRGSVDQRAICGVGDRGAVVLDHRD